MTQTTAVEFQRKFGEFQHKALREPVEITRHGRRELVLMSADPTGSWQPPDGPIGPLTRRRSRSRLSHAPRWTVSMRRSTS